MKTKVALDDSYNSRVILPAILRSQTGNNKGLHRSEYSSTIKAQDTYSYLSTF